METFERKIREMEDVKDKNKRILLFSKYLIRTDLKVKSDKTSSFNVKLHGFSSDGQTITVHSPNYMFKKGTNLTLTKVLGRYLEINCVTEDTKPGNLFTAKINKLILAKKERGVVRIAPPPGLVYVTNVRISKTSLDVEMESIPTFIKINFNDFESKLMNQFDYIKIDVFKPSLDEKFFMVRTSGKSIYIKDTQDPESYKPIYEEDFIDCKEEFMDEIPKLMKDYKNKKIVSEVIMPIIYVNDNNDSVPIGYIHILSKTSIIEYEKIMDVKVLTFEMIDRIRDSNMIVNSSKYEIMDISKSGIRVKITERELSEVIVQQPGFTFDIVFKMQAPVIVYGVICFLSKDKDGNLILGMEYTGFREGDKIRYYENLKLMAIQKKRLEISEFKNEGNKSILI